MDAGRDLDVAVAQRVCSLMVMLDHQGEDHAVIDPRRRVSAPLPHYSTDTADAYFVSEYLQAKGFYCHVRSAIQDGEAVYVVAFYRDPQGGDRHTGIALTIPHALCLAALSVADHGAF